MSSSKRKVDELLVKVNKNQSPIIQPQMLTKHLAVPSTKDNQSIQKHRLPQRSSPLVAPIVLLTGHEASILSCCFDKTGDHFASCDSNGQILLWNSFNQNENYGLIKQKKNPFTNIKWSQKLFASSHDQTVHSYDPETGQLLKRYPHKTLINSIATNNSSLLASVGDDSTCLLFDTRQDSKYSVNLIKHEFPLLGVELGMCVYTGGIDGIIRSFDLRNASVPLYTLESHTDSVTSLKLQDDKLVSNSLDNTVQVHDIRPYSSKRLLKTLLGAPSGTDKGIHRPSISKDGNHVVCGSADKTVVVWSLKSGRILYKLPGHKGGVMECDWHPEHPIVLSGSIDKTLFLGELAVDVLNR